MIFVSAQLFHSVPIFKLVSFERLARTVAPSSLILLLLTFKCLKYRSSMRERVAASLRPFLRLSSASLGRFLTTSSHIRSPILCSPASIAPYWGQAWEPYCCASAALSGLPAHWKCSHRLTRSSQYDHLVSFNCVPIESSCNCPIMAIWTTERAVIWHFSISHRRLPVWSLSKVVLFRSSLKKVLRMLHCASERVLRLGREANSLATLLQSLDVQSWKTI